MQIKPPLSISESTNTESGDNATHPQQGRANPVTTDAAEAFFGGHHLGSVVQVQSEEVDGGAD